MISNPRFERLANRGTNAYKTMGTLTLCKVATHMILLRCGVSLRGANDFRD